MAKDETKEGTAAVVHEKILATDGNAEKIAERVRGFQQGFVVTDKDGNEAMESLVKEILILVDAYERSYDAEKLAPAITAMAFTGVRQVLEAGLLNLRNAGCDKAEPDEKLVAIIKQTIGEEAWKEKVGGPIYNKSAFGGFAAAVALFDNHKAETFKAMDTSGK